MNKPDWKDAPEWAKWVAQDADGDWYWWEGLPTCTEDHFEYWMPSKEAIENCMYSFTRAAQGLKNESWQETLEEQPPC